MRHLLPLLSALLLLPACDSGEADKKAAEAAKAKEEKEKKEQEETDKRIAERKAQREAEEKKKAEEDEARRAEMLKLVVVPDPMPKKSPSCQDVGDAHDAYVRRLGDPEMIKQWDESGRDKEMPMTVVRCNQADSNKVALCQKNALDNATAIMLGHETELLDKCIDKFGKAGGRPGGVPPKGGIPPKPGG